MAQPLAARAAVADRVLIERLWRANLPVEHGFVPLEVEGALPDDLRGTLLRNGPGLFEHGGVRYAHPFEGDGAITAVRFGEGGARGACRVTESAGLRDERAAGRHLYNFSASWPRRLRNVLTGRQKNTANTSVLAWQGRVLALMEAGRPTEIEVGPSDLRTLGETDLGGVVGPAFSAHPHRVPARRATYNFGVEMGRRTVLRLYELPDAGAARRVATVPLPAPVMIHDFVCTERHAVWFVHPLEVDVPRLLTGRARSLTELFRWRGEHASEVIVVPLDRPEEVVRFEVPHGWVWHFASARARGERAIVVDYVRYRDASSFRAIGRAGEDFDAGVPHRAVIDLAARTFRTDAVADCEGDFPRVHPALEAGAYRDVWMASDGERAIARVDVERGTVERCWLDDRLVGGEPIPVPKRGAGGERDVWVLVLAYDAARDRSGVLVLDGARWPAPPVAAAWFAHRIPVTFHGAWVPA